MKKNRYLLLGTCLAILIALPSFAEMQHGTKRSDQPTQNTELSNRYPAFISSVKKIGKQQLHSTKTLSLPLSKNSAAEAIQLYGSMIYNNSWTDEYSAPYGIYSFPVTDNTTFELVQKDPYLKANGGGIYIDGTYYCVRYVEYYGEISVVHFQSFDTDTWERNIFEETDVTSISLDMTYDIATQQVYGCFYNANMDGYVFGTLNLTNGSVTPICDMAQGFYVMAANARGDLYGIDSNGDLYQIEKTSGNLHLIGATGVNPQGIQSGTFDINSGQLYWAASLADGSGALYEVNIETGKAQQISTLPNDAQITGLFIKNEIAPAGTPDMIRDLSVSFEGTSTSGTITFTLPTTSFTGEPLQGMLSYTLMIDEVVEQTSQGACGETVEYPCTLEPGLHTITVSASNEIGSSAPNTVKIWIGKDIPEKVPNLQLTQQDGSITLSWEAPAKGAHGGYLPEATYTYRIVRQPGDLILADNHTTTTYTDSTPFDGIAYYHYEVTAFDGTDFGETATTEEYLLGDAFIPPYIKNFADGNGFELFTVIDANNDNNTWGYNSAEGCARYSYSRSYDADDWLISPPVKLSSSELYEVSVQAKDGGYPEKIKVCLGNNATVEGMTIDVIPVTELTTGEYVTLKGFVQVATGGNYHIGIQACSDRDQYNLSVKEIRLAISDDGIAPISDLTVKAGTDSNPGSLQADITFTTPSLTMKGETLQSPLIKAELYRNNELIKTFESPATGTQLQYTDNTPTQGINTYKVIVYANEGIGAPATESLYIGIDTPDIVQNIVLGESNGKAILSWEAPQHGINGGYIDTEALTYTIQRSDEKIVAQNIPELSFTDNDIYTANGQIFVYYIIYAHSAAGTGNGGISMGRTFGTPYPAPLYESFAGASPQNNPWVTTRVKGNGYWEMVETGTFPNVAPQDADAGLVSFVPDGVDCEARLHSPKLDIKALQNPTLQFYVNHPGDNSRLAVVISTDGTTFTPIYEISRSELSGKWAQYQVPLGEYKSYEYIMFGFTGYNDLVPDAYNKIHVDNISLIDLLSHDLAVNNLQGAGSIPAGRTAEYIVTVENIGTKAATGYNVELYANEQLVCTVEGEPLSPQNTTDYTLQYTPSLEESHVTLRVNVNYNNDLNTGNNSLTRDIEITQSDYPAVTVIEARQTGATVEVTWNEPNYTEGVARAVTDDMESYKAFAIDNIGEWTMIDNDGLPTHGLSDGMGGTIQYDNVNSPMAFQVFNPALVGLEETAWACFSGSQVLSCMASNGGANDDWLISPLLHSQNRSISFYAKSLTDELGLEQFEVLYSSDGTALEDFTAISEIESAPVEWTRYNYELPADARYFAIHCVSDDRFVFLVDDITYTPASVEAEMLELKGYNIYRNGNKLNETPVVGTHYTDMPEETNTYLYKVTAVYDKGESAYSEEVSVNYVAGLNESVQQGVKIIAGENEIIVLNATGKEIRIFTPDGKLVRLTTGDNITHIRVSDGIYIVQTGNNRVKVIVK